MGRHSYVFLRLRHDVPIRRRGDVPLRRLGDVPPRRRWVFNLRHTCDLAGTHKDSRYDVAKTSCCRVGSFHIFVTSISSFFHLESFWNSLREIFLSARTVTSIMIHIFSSNFFIVMFGSFASIFLSVRLLPCFLLLVVVYVHTIFLCGAA